MRRYVYVLEHFYYYGKNSEHTEIKMLGVYSTKHKAQNAVYKYLKITGFKDFTPDCFRVTRYKIDKTDLCIMRNLLCK